MSRLGAGTPVLRVAVPGGNGAGRLGAGAACHQPVGRRHRSAGGRSTRAAHRAPHRVQRTGDGLGDTDRVRAGRDRRIPSVGAGDPERQRARVGRWTWRLTARSLARQHPDARGSRRRRRASAGTCRTPGIRRVVARPCLIRVVGVGGRSRAVRRARHVAGRDTAEPATQRRARGAGPPIRVRRRACAFTCVNLEYRAVTTSREYRTGPGPPHLQLDDRVADAWPCRASGVMQLGGAKYLTTGWRGESFAL